MRADVDAVVVTPAHQYPTGAVLPRRASRRAHRLGRSPRRDDHRGRLRQRVPLRPRADRRDAGPVRRSRGYVGTASKVLAPGLRLGWIVAPSRLAADIAHVKMAADHGSAALDQLALADFIARGELDRHLRRMRILTAADATCCSTRSSATCPDPAVRRVGGPARAGHAARRDRRGRHSWRLRRPPASVSRGSGRDRPHRRRPAVSSSGTAWFPRIASTSASSDWHRSSRRIGLSVRGRAHRGAHTDHSSPWR